MNLNNLQRKDYETHKSVFRLYIPSHLYTIVCLKMSYETYKRAQPFQKTTFCRLISLTSSLVVVVAADSWHYPD